MAEKKFRKIWTKEVMFIQEDELLIDLIVNKGLDH